MYLKQDALPNPRERVSVCRRLSTFSLSIQSDVRIEIKIPPFLRSLWSGPRPSTAVERFRDPVLDFGIRATPVQAIEHDPVTRHDPGPYVSEHGQYLSLYLGASSADGVHAVMDCRAPDALVFSYTQIMAGFSRFVPDPDCIGMLGLGGGSLAKYCFRAFPRSKIFVAEIYQEVIALRRRFLVPEDDERFSILLADGAQFVKRSRGRFDVLLVDAFDEGGHLAHLGTRRFYRNCHRALTDRGVLVLNFSAEAWRSAVSPLRKTFRDQVVLYRTPDGDNVIAFASKRGLPAADLASGL